MSEGPLRECSDSFCLELRFSMYKEGVSLREVFSVQVTKARKNIAVTKLLLSSVCSNDGHVEKMVIGVSYACITRESPGM